MDLRHGASERQWCPGLQRKGLNRVEVLQHVVDAAGRRVVARREFGHELLHDAAVGAAAGESGGNLRGVDAARLCELHRLCDRLEGQRAEQLVDELRRLPGTRAPHQRVIGAEVLHHGAAALEILFAASRHHRETSGTRTRCSARQRAVDPCHAGFALEPRRHALRRGGVDRRHVDQQLLRLRGLRHAIGSEQRGINDVGVVEAQDHEGRRLRRRSRRRGGSCTQCREPVELRRVEVEDMQAVAALKEPRGDGAAHDAGADHCDVMGHGCVLCTRRLRLR